MVLISPLTPCRVGWKLTGILCARPALQRFTPHGLELDPRQVFANYASSTRQLWTCEHLTELTIALTPTPELDSEQQIGLSTAIFR
ncbi:hypothetical protein BGW39_005728 [Mortierella sp. 14UC]|nr:hypothetical protein BGW39_005728 [Mortierella sp. 14UC]